MALINLNECNQACFGCIKKYKQKHILKKGEKFGVQCSGIPKEYISKDILTTLTEEERGTALSLLDPVEWAKVNLDWHCEDPTGEIWKRKDSVEYLNWQKNHPDIKTSRYHRLYQSEVLRCSAKYIVMRMGRQLGKCLAPGTLIQMADGSLRAIEDIQDGEQVFSFNETNKSFEPKKANRFSNGEKFIYRLTLSDGRSIDVTDNHKFLAKQKESYFRADWTEVKDLTLDHYLAIPNKNFSKTESDKNNPLLFMKVKEIIPLHMSQTWDLEVEDTHNFIANNILTHNSESLAIKVLHAAFTNEGFKIIFLAPFQSHVELFFGRLNELIQNNPELANGIHRFVKAPNYTIELKNGTIIRGFSSGARSGMSADPVRGQNANLLVLDEADYLADKDLDSVYSLITNHPEAVVIMSSTPTGKRGKFYSNCHSKEWKEFHYPSTCNPLWNNKMDEFFKNNLSSLGYDHEVLGNFGEEEEGVFQNAYVDAAEEEYNYAQCKPEPGWFYTIGVDWNDVKNGSSITVLGFDQYTKIFKVVHRKRVSKEGWNQLAACEAIAETNRIWRPLHIYLDKGFGGTNAEVLRTFGMSALTDKARGAGHPDAKLRFVKTFDFGSTVEVIDPFTKKKVKKPAKGFLVENLLRRFETATIKYSSNDKSLKKQLENYIIDHVTTSGAAVYKPRSEEIGDHDLDSLMLAQAAFSLEETELGRAFYSTTIGFSGQIGEITDHPVPEGDLVVTNDKKISRKDKLKEKEPSSRTDVFSGENNLLGETPGSHLNERSTGVKLWAWPGFERDAPRPDIKSNRSPAKGKPLRKHF